MNKKTILLSFSGGLDSTVSALKLRNAGHLVTLGYVQWNIPGSPFGELQKKAAKSLSEVLDTPLKVLANVEAYSHAKWSWVQVIASMILWEASYPIKRYDAVAFGMQVTGCESWQRVEYTRAVVENNAKVVNYSGELLFPVDGLGRQEMWAEVPNDMKPLLWCCNIPNQDGTRCGHCYKCIHDRNQI